MIPHCLPVLRRMRRTRAFLPQALHHSRVTPHHKLWYLLLSIINVWLLTGLIPWYAVSIVLFHIEGALLAW